MKWEQLLSTARLGGDIEIPYGKDLFKTSEFEKDYWRIIDCASFRRLQDKTQVFPLDKSDFVRTRLTHSLEVSVIGKQLVAMVYSNLNSKKYKLDKEGIKKYPFSAEQAQDAAEIVACAGLLHDIGNPPFGHFGEDVVHAWLENHLLELSYVDKETGKTIALLRKVPDKDNRDEFKIEEIAKKEIIEDLKHFEGNAQAFRLLTKLHDVDSDYGLNLTAAVLNTIVKYPTDSLHIDADSKNVCIHKLGVYDADRDFFDQVAKATGTFFDGAYHRHPLTFILEAADDIAYATADLEDSFKKGLFTIKEFYDFFLEKVEAIQPNNTTNMEKTRILIEYLDACYKESETPLKAFQRWINYVRHWLVYCAAYGFVSHYTEIMEGRFQQELLAVTFHEQTMPILKAAMVEFTFPSPGIIKLELAAETIIEGLMERFVPAAIDWDVESTSRHTKRKAEKKLMTLVSENHKSAYKRFKKEGDKTYNLYLRLLLIADFVSGMTDSYAKALYQELSGI